MKGASMYTEFFKAALVRAVRTMAQVAVAQISTNGVGLTDISWGGVASVAAVAGIASILTSIATGLPEVDVNTPVIERGKHVGDE